MLKNEVKQMSKCGAGNHLSGSRLRTVSVLEKISRCHNHRIFHARFQKIFIAGQ